MEIELTGRYYYVVRVLDEVKKLFSKRILTVKTVVNNAYSSGNTTIRIYLMDDDSTLYRLLKIPFRNVKAHVKLADSYQVIEYANLNNSSYLEYVGSSNSISMNLEEFEDLEHYDLRMQLNGVRC